MVCPSFTQNIDTLERIAGLPQDLIIEAHGELGALLVVEPCADIVVIHTGSFAEAECLACKKVYTKESIKPQIEQGEVVWCTEAYCQGSDEALVRSRLTCD